MFWVVALLMVAGGQALSTFRVGSYCGPSGCISHDGRPYKFTPEEVANHVSCGPTGCITKDGNNIQFLPALPARHRRSAPANPQEWIIGASGAINTITGQVVQFTEGGVQPLVDGPSGTVFSDGTLLQKRGKRSAANPQEWIIGASGAINTITGQVVQFTEGGVQPLVDGPSGTVFSDGTLLQKRGKRSVTGNIIGPGGIITRDGRNIQLPPGVTVVLDSKSGIILSNGDNIQLNPV